MVSGEDEPSGRRTAGARSQGSLRERVERTAAWGELRFVRELAGTIRDPVLLVERDGEPFIARETRRSAEALSWLETVHAQAREVGLVTPDPVRSRNGNLVDDGISLQRFIEGRPPDARSLARLRSLLRGLHEATRGAHQRPGFASSAALVRLPRGSDIDLSVMPAHVVEACRAAWEPLAEAPRSVVHGDLRRENILVTPDGGVALVDWDEARVDASILDEVALSIALGGRPRPGWEAAETALRAWEVASCWGLEPTHARRLAARLPGLLGGGSGTIPP